MAPSWLKELTEHRGGANVSARSVLLALLAVLVGCTKPLKPDDLSQHDPVYRETEIRQDRPQLDGEVFDAQEVDPRLHEAFATADKKAERAVGNVKRDGKFIVHFWKAKKRILKSDFGIDWKSPAELNPTIAYGGYGAPLLTDVEIGELTKLVDAHKQVRPEIIKGMWRDLWGAVLVSTLSPSDGDNIIYSFAGHDRSWEFIRRDIVQE
jgi:hypothetical protein